MKFYRKPILLAGLMFASVLCGAAPWFSKRDTIPADPKDVSSPEAVVAALYDVISGPAGQKRNWDRLRTLVLPTARFIPTSTKPDGTVTKRELTVEQYIAQAGPFLEKKGFFEREIAHHGETYASIAHWFSTYESRLLATGEKPFARGINSIQLFYDGKRWWLVSILWASEMEKNPLPERYLKESKNLSEITPKK